MTDPSIDLSLLEGLRFRCRPDCGLCCYTTPAVDAAEAAALVQIEPEVPLLAGGSGWRYVAGQGEGGACHFLRANRCRAYRARPFACRKFPLSVHLAPALQATAVLSCPGLERPAWAGGAPSRGPAEGLDEEIAAVVAEARRPEHLRRRTEGVRRWERFVRVRSRRSEEVDPARLSELLSDGMLERTVASYPPAPDPEPPESLEELPIAFVPGSGLVALESADRSIELWRLEGSGAASSSAGTFHVPRDPPKLTAEAERALIGYLRHLLRREFTYAAAAAWIDGTEFRLVNAVAVDLGRFGSLALARAEVLRQFRGAPANALGAEDLWEGIRATDGEFLDRPTLAGVL